MSVIRVVGTLAVFAWSLSAASTHSQDCSNLPTTFTGNEFPTGDFFTNFNNPCYTITLGTGVGAIEYGDLNATYYQLYFKVDPRYQLILLGAFPNTRYFSISLNDAHSALSQSILDTNIAPLTSHYINPYLPGVSYVSGQQYAVPISFGGTPGNLETGCQMNGYNVDVNGLDATQRHPGMDWNTDLGFFAQFPGTVHHAVDTPQHSNPNTSGLILVRAYLNDSTSSYANNPHVIVRDVASGCAYPAQYALDTLQIVEDNTKTSGAWLNSTQCRGHKTYETGYLPRLCNAPPAAPNVLQWGRLPEYVPATNPNAAYITAGVPAGFPATLAAAGEVMRIRIRVPVTPPTPCESGCVRSGTEQMRYMSLSFTASAGNTLASIADTAFTKDSDGYATLIVGTGATIPKWITSANGYTLLDLTAINNYQQLSLLSLRHIIPSNGFNCAGQYVPYRTAVDTPAGNLLGDYAPVVDYPVATSLPHKASALKSASACGVFPPGQPGVEPACRVLPALPPIITSVVTQCPAPGCKQFAAQTDPPITIVGEGFGVFPEGSPFTGTSKYLEVEDFTRGWVAGYTGSTCTVSISSWYGNSIQFVANVNESGNCPLESGDQLGVVVWNPQTNISTMANITAE